MTLTVIAMAVDLCGGGGKGRLSAEYSTLININTMLISCINFHAYFNAASCSLIFKTENTGCRKVLFVRGPASVVVCNPSEYTATPTPRAELKVNL